MGLNKSKIIALSLLLSTAFFSFTACEKDDDNNTTQQEEQQDANKPDSTNTNEPTDTTDSNITSDTTGTAAQGVTVSGKVGNYTYVDLGLPSGTKWATYNVGASKPTEYGDYFAWGETSPKENYIWKTYKYVAESYKSLFNDFGSGYGCNKYTIADGYNEKLDSVAWYDSKGNFIGDSLITLLAEDDAATANWGTGWRMPTRAEQDELRYNCDWEWTDNFNGSGVAGYIVTSITNGNTLFLPAAGYRSGTDLLHAGGYGYYWSPSLCVYRSNCAYNFNFGSDFTGWDDRSRFLGKSVRAVVK